MFNLPPAQDYRLSYPPLTQAIVQIQFPLIAKLATLSGVAPIQESLSEDFPFMERVQETSFLTPLEMSGEIDVATELTNSWHFSDDDGRVLAIGTNSLTLSMSHQYDGSKDFIKRLSKVLKSISAHLNIRRCDRLGLRYLDVVPTDDGYGMPWSGWFRSELLGWPSSSVVAERSRVESSLSQTQITTPPDDINDIPAHMQAVIRHGVVNGGTTVPGIPPVQITGRSFLLDLDFYIVAQQVFDVAQVVSQTRLMHRQIDSFFRWSLTLEGERHFGLKERA